VLGRRELRIGCALESALVVALTAGWGIARGSHDPALDDAGLFAGMALSVVAYAGAVAAAWRAGPNAQRGERVLRSGYHLYAVAALGLVQLLVLIPVGIVAGDLAFPLLGSVLGCGLGGVALGMAASLAGLSLVVSARLGPGAGVPARASMGVALASAILTAVGLGLGSDVKLRARDIGGFFLVLLGLTGETTSAPWLWTARAAALVGAVALFVLARAVRHHGVRGDQRG
jgi:hypothetical protein